MEERSALQQLMDGVADSNMYTRAQYHVTLKKLILALTHTPFNDDVFVFIEGTKNGIGNPHSYRGYYSDLAFEISTEPKTLSKTLEMVTGCLECCFGGWKGGEFIMKENTPLWIAEQGCSGGSAIMEVKYLNGAVQLACKNIEF